MSDLHQCELHRIAYWHPSGCPMCKSDAERFDLARALLQARADAAAAVELVVERAAELADDYGAGPSLVDDIRALAPDAGTAELAKLRGERDDAQREAVNLASFMARTFHPDVPQWKPLDYPAGVISQIDNMVAGLAASLAAQTEQLASLVASLTEVSAACHATARDRDLSEFELAFMRKVDAALDAAALAAMTPEERALCERSLAERDAWKKVAEGQG